MSLGTEHERPCSFDPACLVPGNSKAGQAFDCEPCLTGDMAPCHLHRIDMQQRAILRAEDSDGLDGMQNTGLVIGRHGTDERRAVLLEGRFERLKTQTAIGQHWQNVMITRRQAHCIVFCCTDQQASPLAKSMNCQRVGLCAAGCENNLFRPGFPEAADGLPGGFEQASRFTSRSMDR